LLEPKRIDTYARTKTQNAFHLLGVQFLGLMHMLKKKLKKKHKKEEIVDEPRLQL
jgi:hypothetical protein